MTALVLLLVFAAPPDTDYEKVLKAFNEKKWELVDKLGARFLQEKPDSKFASSVRYFRASAFYGRKRYEDAVAVCRAHLRLHKGASTEPAVRRILVKSLNATGRYEEVARINPKYKRVRKGVVLDYDGKYKDDPRLARILDALPRLRSVALTNIRGFLGEKIPDTFLVRVADSGADQSGLWAHVQTERVHAATRSVLVLRSEHLVLGTHDLARTLVHEFYHCVQRERLGELVHETVPPWAREGAALLVASQGESRMRSLARYAGVDALRKDPVDDLVNGLKGRHTLEDYAEDAAAFLAMQERHGRDKAVALLKRLLETPDVERAIREVLGEDFKTFETRAMAHARKRLAPLVEEGRGEILAAQAKLEAKDYEGALKSLVEKGVYAPAVRYYRALALHRLGRHDEALRFVRDKGLARTTLVGDAKLLELRILKALKHGDFAEASRRARLDLEPFHVYPRVLELLDD